MEPTPQPYDPLDDAFFDSLLDDSFDSDTLLPALGPNCDDVIRDPFLPQPFCAERALYVCDFIRQLPPDAETVARQVFRR